jgi:hypothetical protein
MSAAPARPYGQKIEGYVDDAENLTQEGRKEHPVKAVIGDVARRAGELRDIVGPEIGLLAMAPGGAGAGIRPEAPEIDPNPGPMARIPGRDYNQGPDLGKQAPGGPNTKPPALAMPEAPEAPEINPSPGPLARVPGHEYNPADLGKQAPGGPNTKPPALAMPASSIGQPEPVAPQGAMPVPKTVNDIVDKAIPPLKPNVPLKDQRPSFGQVTSDIMNQNTEQEAARPLANDKGPQRAMKVGDITEPPKEAVPHRAVIIHEGKPYGVEATSGTKMYEATKGDTALAKEYHLLRNNDVRQAFLNLGGDVNTVGMEGQRFKVGPSTRNERTQMTDWMLDQGHTPREIIDATKPGWKPKP